MGAKKYAFTYIVKVDPEIADLVPGYFQHRKEDSIALNQFLVQKNLLGIRRICHNLMGSCASYGFDELEMVALELSASAKKEHWEAVEHWILEFQDYLSKVEFQ